MPIVTCPHCARKIELPYQELTWRIGCKACKQVFIPLGEFAQPPPIRSPIDPEPISESQSRRSISPLRILGILAIVVGVFLVGFFWFIYDTTVASYEPDRLYGWPIREIRIYNVGKEQNRLVGILIGLGSIGFGLLLTFRFPAS